MSTATVIKLPAPPAGWRTVAEAENTAGGLGMSPLPLVFRDKKPLGKSHPALTIRPMTPSEFTALAGRDYKYALGIIGGHSGWFSPDIDIGDTDQTRALVEKHLGASRAGIDGNPEHGGKLLYLGPLCIST